MENASRKRQVNTPTLSAIRKNDFKYC